MNHDDFLRAFEQIVEASTGSVTGAERLDSLGNWDSVAMMSLMGVISEKADVWLSPKKVATCGTVDDIFRLVQGV